MPLNRLQDKQDAQYAVGPHFAARSLPHANFDSVGRPTEANCASDVQELIIQGNMLA